MGADRIVVVENLIAAGLGDHGRMLFIQRCLKNDKELHKSDEKYIEALAARMKASQDGDVARPGVLEMARTLAQEHVGDRDRVDQILGTLERDDQLHISDEEYVHSKYQEYLQSAMSVRKTAGADTGPIETHAILEAGAKSETDRVQALVEKDRLELETLSAYKKQLADRTSIHNDLLLDIKKEQQSIMTLVREQNNTIDEQSRVLDAIRYERAQLESDSQRLLGITTELAEEKKKVAAARKENRELKEKGRSLARTCKDLERTNNILQKEREKMAKKIEEEQTKLREQATLKHALKQDTDKLNEIRKKGDASSQGVKMAERVLQESKRPPSK